MAACDVRLTSLSQDAAVAQPTPFSQCRTTPSRKRNQEIRNSLCRDRLRRGHCCDAKQTGVSAWTIPLTLRNRTSGKEGVF